MVGRRVNASARVSGQDGAEERDGLAEQAAALLDAMPTPLLACDTSGCPVRWNAALGKLLDVPPDRHRDGIGDAAVDIITNAFPTLAEVCAPSTTGGAARRSVATLDTAAGERVFELESVRSSCERHPLDTFVVAVREITVERSLSTRLYAAREEIVQFKYHVSHDLSAPIASARGLLGIIEHSVEEGTLDEVPELLEETNAQLTRLQRLIGDLMSLARAGADMPKPEVVDLRELVDEIAASISLHSRELEVSVTLSFDAPTLTTERVRLRQILANLISNARKFQDPEEIAPCIHVSVKDAGDDWRISVADNGIGMSRRTADRAFDMFTRGTSTHPGHGLGLHIVLKHVDLLGGSVAVGGISKPTTIDVRLPKVPPTIGVVDPSDVE